MSEIVEITEANFETEVLQSELPVLVDLWAVWCGPCKMIEPNVKQVAAEYAGRLKVGKLNVDENPSITAKYGVRSIPTLLLFKNGEVKNVVVGAVPKSMIVKKVEEVLNA